jgi:hypothetical protein
VPPKILGSAEIAGIPGKLVAGSSQTNRPGPVVDSLRQGGVMRRSGGDSRKE